MSKALMTGGHGRECKGRHTNDEAVLLLQRSKTMALDAKKEAESALETVKGSVEKITNDFFNKSKAVKEDGKKKANETVSNIHANGHAVAAGKEFFCQDCASLKRRHL